MTAKNFNPLIAKIENIVKIWSMRNLSVFGKVAVIKAHLQSQLVYQLLFLPSSLKCFQQTVEQLLFKYLWNNKPDTVKRVTMLANKDESGLNMPNIQYQDTSLKIAWVQRLVCQSESNWAKLAIVHLPPGGDTIFMANISQNDICRSKLLPKSVFWKDVLLAWVKLNYIENTPADKID